jgi:hypothetical protein
MLLLLLWVLRKHNITSIMGIPLDTKKLALAYSLVSLAIAFNFLH